jgi:hypothetical protein
MKTSNRKIRTKKALVYSALLLFIFLTAFLSTYHNHEFGEPHKDCPAYILGITFHSPDNITFETAGKVTFYDFTFLRQSNEESNYTIIYTSLQGRAPPFSI